MKTIIRARVLAMNVEHTIKSKHLTLEEADVWVKKNLNETGQVIEIEHWKKVKSDLENRFHRLKVVRKNPNYKDPTIMSFGEINVEQYKKKIDA